MKSLRTICSLVFSTIMFINVVVLTANAIAMNLAKVTGTLSYPRFSPALGSEATIYITLVDVSPRQDSSGDIIVRLTIVKPTPSPIYFELKYNPAQIDRQHTYAIQARITERGKVIFTNNSPYPVITGGNPHKVDIVLTPKQLP